MRKTKIICTLGPSTDKEGVLRDLIANGMNVARFNFSHGSHEEHLGRLEKLKALREELGKPVAALLDTKGPEIRLKDFKNGVENLVAGQTFTLTTRDVEGTNEICSITYKDLPMDVEPNGTIMLDDGLIKLQIQTVNDTDIVCTVLNNGKIKNKKGVNVPGVHLSMPYMSQRDKDDIIFGIQQGYDFIAASFVRTASFQAQNDEGQGTSAGTDNTGSSQAQNGEGQGASAGMASTDESQAQRGEVQGPPAASASTGSSQAQSGEVQGPPAADGATEGGESTEEAVTKPVNGTAATSFKEENSWYKSPFIWIGIATVLAVIGILGYHLKKR